MKRIVSILALLVAFSAGAQELKVAHIFSDHMVLQRETNVSIWGWGVPGKNLRVSTSWDRMSYKATVQEDSTWRVTVPTGAAGGPYVINITSGNERLQIADVMLGEVWLCSGQSNMEMPISGFGFQEVEGATDAIMEAMETAKDVRVFNIKTPKKTAQIDDVDTQWTLSTPDVVSWTSAVGYFFAKRLTKSLGVPVGIIVNAWGGSRIEPWMTKEVINNAGLTKEELEAIYAIQDQEGRWPETPELIWNGRVAPIAGYTAKGIIWYQGCSNIGQKCYDKLQKAMVEMWREAWGQDLPFIFTLLAPYTHGDPDGRWRSHFVENQLHTEKILSNSWAVCTETLGNKVTIHPSKKREIADMMVQRALQNVYGINPGVSIELPRLDTWTVEADGSVKVRLTQVWSNLGSISSREVVGFELAGEDRNFHLADAEIDWDGQTIIVRCADVPKPVAVRYGFRNWMGANLQKSNGIPVPPFRSDDWEY